MVKGCYSDVNNKYNTSIGSSLIKLYVYVDFVVLSISFIRSSLRISSFSQLTLHNQQVPSGVSGADIK